MCSSDLFPSHDILGDDTSFVAKVEEEVDTRNYGQIVADKVAAFGGSWTFIIAFLFSFPFGLVPM